MDVQAIRAVLLGHANEVQPLKKQLEDVGVAVDEDDAYGRSADTSHPRPTG
jgi:hypothetical protein